MAIGNRAVLYSPVTIIFYNTREHSGNTRARVFSQTLAHGNSKNEIRETKDEEGKKRGVSVERSKERSPEGLCLI